MQLHKKWLAGLVPCVTLLLILSLSVGDVESKRGRKRSKGRGRQRPRHFGPSGGIAVQNPGQGTVNIPPTVATGKGQVCQNTGPFGADVKSNISELWDEVQSLSNPIHIHIYRGHAWGGGPDHTSHHFPDGPSGKERYRPHSPGGKGHHRPHTPGGKGRPPSHGHREKGHPPRTPNGKSGKGHPHPHSPGKGKPAPGGKGPGPRSHSPYRHRPTHETHIHVHVTLDTEENKFEKLIAKHHDDDEYARCDLRTPEKGSPVTGTILMRQMFQEPIEIKVNISGMAAFRPRGMAADHKCKHGLHVHKFADYTQGCTSFGGHYNPKNTTHGPDNDEESHSGDWGNIECDKDGNCEATMNITNSVLLGPLSIIGRGIVLHQLEDDLGQVGDKGSLTTGNAGKRIACCAIVRTGPPDEDW